MCDRIVEVSIPSRTRVLLSIRSQFLCSTFKHILEMTLINRILTMPSSVYRVEVVIFGAECPVKPMSNVWGIVPMMVGRDLKVDE